VRSRIRDVVLATVTIVAVLGGAIVVAALVTSQNDPAPRLAVVPPHTSAPATSLPPTRPTLRGTPAASGGPSGPGSRSSPSLPTATSSVCVPRHVQTDLTVITFNIHSARAQDGSVHLTQIAHALAGWHPDIVLLQEVDRGRIWTGRVDMPTVLADDLHMAWTFGVNVRRSPTNEYGTAILSRYPILRPRNMLLPDPAGTQQRGLLHATIDVDGMLLSVYGTHLENTSPVARLEQIRAIAPVLAADPRPEIFGGDLNSTPSSRIVAKARSVLADSWQAVGRGPGFTHPADAPSIRIDYLFYRSGSGVDLQPLEAQVLGHVVSDHRPVRAVYRLSTGHGVVCVPNLSTGHRH
jgi:endonuclease/exonuclease/phosphatase family metal-dependent hydrolase